MKCYICKSNITTATRHFMKAQNKREKDQFRDLCEVCYSMQMEREGYVLQGNTWTRDEIANLSLDAKSISRIKKRVAEFKAKQICKGEAMNNPEAIKRLEEMPEDKFQAFFAGLPLRVQLCVQGGLVDWRECLANWYIRERMKGGRHE